MSKTVLLTGASGFIGRHILNYLNFGADNFGAGFKVLVTSHEKKADLHAQQIIIDLSKPIQAAALPEVDIVINCAGTHGRNTKDGTKLWNDNVFTAINLSQYYANKNIEQFIHFSSFSINGFQPLDNFKPLPEIPWYECNPSSGYETTKKWGEANVVQSGVPYVVLRPDCIYGEGDPYLLPLFKMAASHRFMAPKGGNGIMHPSYVGDIIQMISLCINKGVTKEIFNVGGECFLNVGAFVMAIHYIMYAEKLKVRKIDGLTLKAAEKTSNAFSRLMNKNVGLPSERIDWFTKVRAIDFSKAVNQLGYKPIRLNEGLQKTVDWYEKNNYINLSASE